MNRITAVLIAVMTLSGCVSTKAVMKSWEGQNIDDVTAAWGAPDSKSDRLNGGSTYTWITTRIVGPSLMQCRQTFVANSEGNLVSWSTSNCPRFGRGFARR